MQFNADWAMVIISCVMVYYNYKLARHSQKSLAKTRKMIEQTFWLANNGHKKEAAEKVVKEWIKKQIAFFQCLGNSLNQHRQFKFEEYDDRDIMNYALQILSKNQYIERIEKCAIYSYNIYFSQEFKNLCKTVSEEYSFDSFTGVLYTKYIEPTIFYQE